MRNFARTVEFELMEQRRGNIHDDFLFFFFTIFLNIESPCLSNFARD